MSKEIINDVKKVFSSLILICPFTYPIIAMPIIINDSMPTPAATNGISIFINPGYWNKKSFKQKLFISLHEWMHVALMHSKRIRTKNHTTYNYASDFSINFMIKEDLGSQFEMPCSLYDPVFEGMTAEQIYTNLDNEIKFRQENKIVPFCSHCKRIFQKGDYNNNLWKDPDIKKCQACKRPTDKDIPEPEFITKEDAINQLMIEQFGTPWGNDLMELPFDADEQAIINSIIQASERYKSFGRGTLPGLYADYIKQLKKSNIPWTRLLYKYAKESLKGTTDRNPFKPDPKYLPFNIFVPTETGKTVSKLVFIIDTSGSMIIENFELAAGCLEKLSTICGKVTVIMADTMVQKVVRLKNMRHELKKGFEIKGRGGTDMHEAMEAADKLKPDLIILYSDMEMGDYPKKPKASVIWLDSSGYRQDKPKYGAYIRIIK